MLDWLMGILSLEFDEETYTRVVSIAAILFTLLLVASFGRLVWRIGEYRRNHMQVPELVWRDLVLDVGFVLPLTSIFLVRAFDITGIRYNIWWVLWTTVPPIMSVGVAAWYEFFRIEGGRPAATPESEPQARVPPEEATT